MGVARGPFAAKVDLGDADAGKAPGISSFSCSDASLAGTVRGVRAIGASWDNETRCGVVEFWLRRRAELRRAMAATALRSYQGRRQVSGARV